MRGQCVAWTLWAALASGVWALVICAKLWVRGADGGGWQEVEVAFGGVGAAPSELGMALRTVRAS